MELDATNKSIVREQIRGAQTGWLEYGCDSKPILLFLHGYPDTAESWMPQINHFKNDYKIVAPFSRGSSLSQSAKLPVKRYGPDSVVLDHLKILKKIDPLKKADIHIVAHDLGVVQAWHLAPYLGGQLKSMSLINGISLAQMARRYANPRQALKSWYIYFFQIPFVADKILERSPGKFLSFAYRKGGLPAVRRPKVKDSVKGVVGPLKQYRALFRSLPRTFFEDYPRIDAPVQILWGEEDPFLVPPKRQEIAPFAKNVEIRMLTGGHWLHLDAPEKTNELIEDFLSKAGKKDD